MNGIETKIIIYIAERILFFIEYIFSGFKTKNHRKGRKTEEKVNIIFQEIQKELRYKSILMENISLIMYNELTQKQEKTQIDHVFITEKNIYVIETKRRMGTIEGEKWGKEWKVTNSKTSYKMMNPFRQNYKHILAILQCMNLEKKYQKMIKGIVVIEGEYQLIGTLNDLVDVNQLKETVIRLEEKSKRKKFSPILIENKIKAKFA